MQDHWASVSEPRSSEAREIELLAQRARRDPMAFTELYDRHVKQVYRFHLARTGDVNDAQDLTSQTFLAALESLQHYSGRGTFSGWLFGIAHHKVADFYRSQRPQVPLEVAEPLIAGEPLPEDLANSRLELSRVSKALRTLPPDQAEAVTLRLFAQLTATEAGQVMGKSAAAVKMLVFRGMGRLQEKLGHMPLEVSR